MRDKLLTHRQAAEMLCIKPNTLYEWVKQKRIQVVKLSKTANRYRESEINRIIDERTREAVGE